MQKDITEVHNTMSVYYGSATWRMYDKLILLCALNDVVLNYRMRTTGRPAVVKLYQCGLDIEWSFIEIT